MIKTARQVMSFVVRVRISQIVRRDLIGFKMIQMVKEELSSFTHRCRVIRICKLQD